MGESHVLKVKKASIRWQPPDGWRVEANRRFPWIPRIA